MKIKCKNCNQIIKGDKKGTYISCQCKKCAIDETQYYTRVIGNFDDWEEINSNLDENKDKYYEKKGEIIKYLSEPCINCGRIRVELYTSGSKICEKCGFDQEKNDFYSNEWGHWIDE